MKMSFIIYDHFCLWFFMKIFSVTDLYRKVIVQAIWFWWFGWLLILVNYTLREILNFCHIPLKKIEKPFLSWSATMVLSPQGNILYPPSICCRHVLKCLSEGSWHRFVESSTTMREKHRKLKKLPGRISKSLCTCALTISSTEWEKFIHW